MDDRSTPSFSEFNPTIIPFQNRLISDIDHGFDYSLGVHECMLSGSVGSAKSLVAAHLAISHCFKFPRARILLGRKALPDLRDTIYTKILEHLEGTVKEDGSLLREGKDYGFADTTCKIWFANGSEFISRSWKDKRYKKLGSLDLSAAIVEEFTENDADDEMAIKYIRMRVGRLPHIPHNWIIYPTNPDSPSHFAYEYFQLGLRQSGQTKNLIPTRHVYFSKTTDNPFLPSWYIEQLKQDLDPKLARRMLDGEWIELTQDILYYAYSEKNYRDRSYEIDTKMPIYISFDFNIGVGKPMSCCLSQYDKAKDTIHYFNESIVEGASTLEQIEEVAARGLLDYDTIYYINGDATGGYRSTKSHATDYDIIVKFMSNYITKSGEAIEFVKKVRRSNPPIRERHNITNAYCKNAAGRVRLYVYKDAKTLDKGFRLTSLKKGGQYLEDDSKPWQHVTTAAGYNIHWIHKNKFSTPTMRYQQIR